MATSHILMDSPATGDVTVKAQDLAGANVWAQSVAGVQQADEIQSRKPTKVIIELSETGNHIVKVEFTDGGQFNNDGEVYDNKSSFETGITSEFEAEVQSKTTS